MAASPETKAEVDDQGASDLCTRFALGKAVTEALDDIGVDIPQDDVRRHLVAKKPAFGAWATEFHGTEMTFADEKMSHKRYFMTIAIKKVSFMDFMAAVIHDDPGPTSTTTTKNHDFKVTRGTKYVLDQLDRDPPKKKHRRHCMYPKWWSPDQGQVICMNSWGDQNDPYPMIDPGNLLILPPASTPTAPTAPHASPLSSTTAGRSIETIYSVDVILQDRKGGYLWGMSAFPDARPGSFPQKARDMCLRGWDNLIIPTYPSHVLGASGGVNDKWNMAVFGVTGVGKSSWINQFRGFTEGHPDAAAIGSPPDECTLQASPYELKENPTLVLSDIPGAFTDEFPIESYYEDTKMESYDACVLLMCGNLTGGDKMKEVELVAKTGKFCYFGYTHIDTVMKDLHGKDDQAKKIRDKMKAFIKKSDITPSQWGSEVFLLTDKPERIMGGWTSDNDKLKETIMEDLLKTDAGVKALNGFLADHSYIEGFVPSQADRQVFGALARAPNKPHALRWYNHIKSFGESKKQFDKASAAFALPGDTKSGDPDTFVHTSPDTVLDTFQDTDINTLPVSYLNMESSLERTKRNTPGDTEPASLDSNLDRNDGAP